MMESGVRRDAQNVERTSSPYGALRPRDAVASPVSAQKPDTAASRCGRLLENSIWRCCDTPSGGTERHAQAESLPHVERGTGH
jgi:hypothetical protein